MSCEVEIDIVLPEAIGGFLPFENWQRPFSDSLRCRLVCSSRFRGPAVPIMMPIPSPPLHRRCREQLRCSLCLSTFHFECRLPSRRGVQYSLEGLRLQHPEGAGAALPSNSLPPDPPWHDFLGTLFHVCTPNVLTT